MRSTNAIALSNRFQVAAAASNETITSSAASQATAATAQNGDVLVITTDGSIRFTTGAAPTAVADDTCELVNEGRWQFTIPAGHRAAVIDA